MFGQQYGQLSISSDIVSTNYCDCLQRFGVNSASQTGNTFAHIGADSWSAGMYSNDVLNGDGSAVFNLGAVSMGGLSPIYMGTTYTQGYMIYNYSSAGNVYVYQLGTYIGIFPVAGLTAANKYQYTFKVERIQNIITYSYLPPAGTAWVRFYTSTGITPTQPLYAIGSLYSLNYAGLGLSDIRNVQLNGFEKKCTRYTRTFDSVTGLVTYYNVTAATPTVVPSLPTTALIC